MLATLALLVFGGLFQEPEVVVATNGSDTNPGTASQPLATLAAAIDKARSNQTHVIRVHGGQYALSASLKLDARDAGLTIVAAAGEHPRFIGGISIPKSAIAKCTDPAILNRIIDTGARQTILEVNLAQVGLSNLPPISPRGYALGKPGAPNELFINGQVQTLAKWPHAGYTKLVAVVNPGKPGAISKLQPSDRPVINIGDRAKLWQNAEDAWVYGFWTFDWADESTKVTGIDSSGNITLASQHHYGYKVGSLCYAENLLEELSAPGEYYIDRPHARMFFIPRAPLESNANVTVSTLSDPLVSISNTNNVSIEGLDFCYTRGNAAEVHNGESVHFKGCAFKQIGGIGVVIEGGHFSGLQSCYVSGTGQGGVTMSGGDRNTLSPGKNIVENCEFTDFSRRSQTYRPAVSLTGVGQLVVHNYMHEAPHCAVLYWGNNHQIAQNRFEHCLKLTSDAGVIYTGRDWTSRGTVIHDNWFADNKGGGAWESAIYFDDVDAGSTASHNLIERGNWGILVGSGRDNTVDGNIIIDCIRGIACDDRSQAAGKPLLPALQATLTKVPYQSDVWKAQYPTLATILDGDPLLPTGNVITNNLLVRAGTATTGYAPVFYAHATMSNNRAVNDIPAADMATIEAMRQAAGVITDDYWRALNDGHH